MFVKFISIIAVLSNNLINCKLVSVDLTDKYTVIGQGIQFQNQDIDVFLGIPYARAPVAGLRFKKPVLIDELSGVYNATQMPEPCVNYNQANDMPWSSQQSGVEDCLYLNIWSPNVDTNSEHILYPVMVWIYGGAFQTGSIDLDLYDGRVLASVGDVVVVTFNYRTGVFGLFYSGTDEAPGNVALHDQRTAIEWVQNNIHKFGGDPQSVTIFGESAGSISAGIHLLSPLSRPLFQRAILQSGSPYHNIGGVNPELALKQSKLIAKDGNCLTIEDNIDFYCMRNLSSNQIKDIYKDIYFKGIALQLIFGEEISPKHPIHTIDNKQINPTQVIMGTNRDEGSSILFMGVPELFARIEPTNMTKAFAIHFIRSLTENWWLGVLSDQQFQQIIDFYMSDVGEDDYVLVRQSLVDLIGDSLFICPSIYFADKLSQVCGSKVFYYQFTHIKHFDNHWGQWMGSPHFDEVQYVFGHPLRYPTNYSEQEIQLSTKLIKSWSSFAHKGEPDNTFGDNVWPLYDENKRQFIEINGNKMNSYQTDGPRLKECQFWRPFFQRIQDSQHEEL